MCIFEADELTENDNKIFNPKGMLFINISNLKEESTLFDEIKKLINIVFDTTPQTYKVSKDQFKFVLTSDDGNNPKLNCIVHGSCKNINNESLLQILSRDNFINEIYTK